MVPALLLQLLLLVVVEVDDGVVVVVALVDVCSSVAGVSAEELSFALSSKMVPWD